MNGNKEFSENIVEFCAAYVEHEWDKKFNKKEENFDDIEKGELEEKLKYFLKKKS